MRIYVRGIAVLVMIMFTIASFGISAYADSGYNTCLDEDFVLPDIVDPEEAKERGYIGRVKDEEKDLYTYVFENANGSHTMRVYGEPVKYVTEEGTIRDVSFAIQPNKSGGFISADNSIMTSFADTLSGGISIEYKDIMIKMIPQISSENDPIASLSDDNRVVSYEIDDTTSYIYKLTSLGFKEDIVVNEYTGQTEYVFLLLTNGLALQKENESYSLVDSENNVKAVIGDVFMLTENEQGNSIETMTAETIIPNSEYLISISLDPNSISEEVASYPIHIDPTIEIKYSNNGAGAIEDVTINNNTTFGGTSGSLHVGRHPTGSISRTLMRFPTLTLNGISANQLIAASIEIRDIMCQSDEDITVECCTYKKTAPSWSEAGTTTWSSVGNAYLGSVLDSHLISYGNGNISSQRYGFDIWELAKAWANGTQSPSKGVVFKAINSFEDQTGSSMKKWHKTFAAYNNSSYRPSLSITYNTGVTRSLYYSKYDPTKYNGSNLTNTTTYQIRYRMNCYGYAFGFILDGPATVDGSGQGYKQQPGEFAAVNDKPSTSTYLIIGNPTALMNSVVNNMTYDANRLGYMLTEYHPTSSTVEQFGVSSRLIAVVTGYSDYHFYMQHSDGTWSHKPGSGAVTNMSLSSNETLTNTNIINCANEGNYQNGALRFYKITKTAVIDYPHGSRCCNDFPCNCQAQSAIYLKEQAGDYLQTAKAKSTGTTACHMDYSKDHDVFCFIPSTTATYTITTTCASGADLNCKLYDNAAVCIKSQTGTGQVNFTIRLVANQKYFFDIYNASNTVTNYNFSITN